MDPSLTALTRTINKLGEAFEAFKDANDERIKALEEGDTGKAAEIGQKVGRIEIDLSKFSKLKSDIEIEIKNQRNRIEELEAGRNLPGTTALTKVQSEYKTAFMDWMRSKGADPGLSHQLTVIERKVLEARVAEMKTVTIGTPSAGGFAVPEEIAREIERQERLFSPVRDLVKVVQAGTSDYKELVDLSGTTSGWVGETTERTATNTPTLRERAPTHGELYAYPVTSEWSLDDIFFNVEQWLTMSVAEEFAIQEGSAVISGSGTNMPTGMVNTPPVVTADTFPPTRSAEAFQCIDVPGSPGDIDGDDLIDLVYLLNSRYRAGATWIMNSASTGIVRKLKTVDGAYHWQPGLQMGQPDRLLGYPVSTWEQMDDFGVEGGGGEFPIGFGNWRRAYVLVDRVGMRVTRDQVTQPGFVKFYVRRREGGIILNNNAAKFIKT